MSSGAGGSGAGGDGTGDGSSSSDGSGNSVGLGGVSTQGPTGMGIGIGDPAGAPAGTSTNSSSVGLGFGQTAANAGLGVGIGSPAAAAAAAGLGAADSAANGGSSFGYGNPGVSTGLGGVSTAAVGPGTAPGAATGSAGGGGSGGGFGRGSNASTYGDAVALNNAILANLSAQMGSPSQNVAGATLGLGSLGALSGAGIGSPMGVVGQPSSTIGNSNPSIAAALANPNSPLNGILGLLSPAQLAHIANNENSNLANMLGAGVGQGSAALGFPAANPTIGSNGPQGTPAPVGSPVGAGAPAGYGFGPGVAAALANPNSPLSGIVGKLGQDPTVASPQAINAALSGMVAAPSLGLRGGQSLAPSPGPPAVSNPASPVAQSQQSQLGSIMGSSPSLAALYGGGSYQGLA